MLDFHLETSFQKPVVGIDEVGRGPLAGPVVSCACVFFNHSIPIEELQEINDSKKLSPVLSQARQGLMLGLGQDLRDIGGTQNTN